MVKAAENQEQPGSDEAFAAPILATDIEAMVQQAVSTALGAAIPALLSDLAMKVPNFGYNPAPNAANVNMSLAPAVDKPGEKGWIKHYRCDNTPFGKIVAFDMDLIDAGMKRGEAVMPGEWIEIRNDEFFATTDNQVRQIEWLRSLPREQGGRPDIYEDTDQGLILRCAIGDCPKFFSSEATLAQHREATHGVKANYHA